MRHCNIPIFVPHTGCPHDCAFCNQKKITGQSTTTTPETAREIIEEHLKTAEADSEVQIAFFGGSFTGIPEEEQRNLLEVANKYIKDGKVTGIRISTRPDYISKNILDMLGGYGVTSIELGVQSMCDEVLIANNRGHTAKDVTNAAGLIREYDFELGLQMMTGLYGSTPERDMETGRKIAELMPDTVRIYPTVVLGGTRLEALLEEGKYIPPSLDDTVELCSFLYELFAEKNIRVIRMGLQATDIICEKGEIKAGAYHSAFGELALSRIERRRLEELAKNCNSDSLTVYVSKNMISKTVGNKRENIKFIEEKYNIKVSVKEKL